jgi:hypothetical protein
LRKNGQDKQKIPEASSVEVGWGTHVFYLVADYSREDGFNVQEEINVLWMRKELKNNGPCVTRVIAYKIWFRVFINM